MSNKGTQTLANIFSRESADQVKNPEKLNEYIRVATPGTWILAVALVVVLAALVVWGFVGTIPQHFVTVGVGVCSGFDPATAELENPDAYKVRNLICLVDAQNAMARQLQEKETHVVFRDGRQVHGTSYLLDTALLGDSEVKELLEGYQINTDWVFALLGSGQYRYVVNVFLDEELDYLYWGEAAQASIVVSEVAPITYLFQ